MTREEWSRDVNAAFLLGMVFGAAIVLLVALVAR